MRWKNVLLVLILSSATSCLLAEDGYELWLRYARIQDPGLIKDYAAVRSVYLLNGSPTRNLIRQELNRGFAGMLGDSLSYAAQLQEGSLVVAGAGDNIALPKDVKEKLLKTGPDGFIIRNLDLQGKRCILITANEDIGLLYGTFHFLRLLQTGESIRELNIQSVPSIQQRILNHWDNLDRTVERGYAGFSLWDWHRLPKYIDQRYHDYARANASIGINGTVLTNVNANALVLTPSYLEKVKALADVFRPYGIKVYLTARFSAPVEIGGLATADPLNAEVIRWWTEKTAEIYRYIPDFGGFLVKANSEGQPGPQNYGRTHADGANVLARALQPYKGIVMWRAFVYSNDVPVDRIRQAYDEFMPLDGKFEPNVLVQVKNGPLDFQPREPFHPLFGAMKKTPLMMEFQLTQEYLGFATHLVYLGTLFEETLSADTYQKGKGSTVAKAIDGSLYNHSLSAIAGVSNIGNDRNWSGHPFAQSNWYAFGRKAWNLSLSPENIAREWAAQTFTKDAAALQTIISMMIGSRETVVNYMTPLGLHHIMGWSHHYGPAPWISNKEREDWTSVYYHRADDDSIGFDRTSRGSNALGQYHPLVAQQFADVRRCPDKYLLWFHRVPWKHRLHSGLTVWEGLAEHYYRGVDEVDQMRDNWMSLSKEIDLERHQAIRSLLDIQYDEACWWRDACLLYFESVSGLRIPDKYPRPEKDLAFYQSLEFPYAP